MKEYGRFCEKLGEPMVPDAKRIAMFIVGRALQGYKLSYIEVGVHAIHRWAEDKGMEGLTSSPLVKRALKVAAKKAVRGVLQKLPLTKQLLRQVVEWLNGEEGPGEWIAVRDTAMFLLGWAGMFRSSELVAVRWEEVQFASGGMMIYIPKSKTDPGEGAWVFVAEGREPGLCPVQAMRRLQQMSRGVGPVFARSAKGETAISKTTVGMRLKKALRAAGVPGYQLYAAHSLRRGGATHAARSGITTRMIQAMGRWRSDAVRLYLYCSPEQLWKGSRKMLVTD